MAFLIWITGLSGSGKTTLAEKVYRNIKEDHPNTLFLDGDSFREITQQTSSHSPRKRFQIALQITRMCKFLVDQDINVVCSTISLFKKIHEINRNKFKDYFEVFIDCNFGELIKRDKKNIYSKAKDGRLKNVVGIDIPYDKPKNPHLVIDNTYKSNFEKNVQVILDSFERRKK